MNFDALFPVPSSAEIKSGLFVLDSETALVGGGKAAKLIGEDAKRYAQAELAKEEKPKRIVLKQVRGKRSADESYRLEITENEITITGGGSGVFWGAQTLRQLIRTGGGILPCGVIEDKPLLRGRGIMLDNTRGKVFSLKTLKRIADTAALYKINQLQIYVENCVDFPFAKELWEKSTPLTTAEIKAFDRYCRLLHIELVPCFATFGHLYNLLEVERYKPLRECDAGDPEKGYWVKKMCHHTLDVTNPESFELTKKIIDYAAPLFSSDTFNICCDETFDLGKGKSASLAAEKGVGRLYVEYLNRVIRYARQYKPKIQLWGDIILQHTELLPEIEPDCIFLNWEYSKDVGPDKTKTFADAGVRQYACPGTQGWNHAVNNLNAAFSNIARFSSYAINYKAEGLLNTDWGDYGHINPVSASVPAFIYGAGAAWSGVPEDTAVYDERISKLEYGCGGVVSAIKKATVNSVASWWNVVVWLYSRKGEIEPFLLERMEGKTTALLDLPQTRAKLAAKTAREAYRELNAVKKNVYPDKRAQIEEILTGIKGEIVIQKWVLAAKKLAGKPAEISLSGLAAEIDRFEKELSRRWKRFYKESELRRLQAALRELAQICRSGEIV